MSGPVYYHGQRGLASFSADQPTFFTTDREGARWYARERGPWGEVPQVYAAMLQVRQPAGFADLEAAIACVGATAAEVARCSPYDGDNLLDFLYVPAVRHALEDMGFDGYAGWDVLTNGEIPVLVAFAPAQITLLDVAGEVSRPQEATAMDLYALQPGDRVRTIDDNVVEIVAPTEDGQWIRVCYLEAAHDPALPGTVDLCHVDELVTVLSTTPGE